MFSALAVFLMVADTRFKVTQPAAHPRSAGLLAPGAMRLVLKPIDAWVEYGRQVLRLGQQALHGSIGGRRAQATAQGTAVATAANQCRSSCRLENDRLRKLLAHAAERVNVHRTGGAEVLYDAARPLHAQA